MTDPILKSKRSQEAVQRFISSHFWERHQSWQDCAHPTSPRFPPGFAAQAIRPDKGKPIFCQSEIYTWYPKQPICNGCLVKQPSSHWNNPFFGADVSLKLSIFSAAVLSPPLQHVDFVILPLQLQGRSPRAEPRGPRPEWAQHVEKTRAARVLMFHCEASPTRHACRKGIPWLANRPGIIPNLARCMATEADVWKETSRYPMISKAYQKGPCVVVRVKLHVFVLFFFLDGRKHGALSLLIARFANVRMLCSRCKALKSTTRIRSFVEVSTFTPWQSTFRL